MAQLPSRTVEIHVDVSEDPAVAIFSLVEDLTIFIVSRISPSQYYICLNGTPQVMGSLK